MCNTSMALYVTPYVANEDLIFEGTRSGYASAKQNFPAKQELLLSEITGLPLDAQMQRIRLDVDERVEGSRRCSCSCPS
jgi:hypothetical protein